MKKISRIATLIMVVVIMSFSLGACGELGKVGKKSFDKIVDQAFINIGLNETEKNVTYNSDHSIEIKASSSTMRDLINKLNKKLNIDMKISQMTNNGSKVYGDTNLTWTKENYNTTVSYSNNKVNFHKLLDECFVLIGDDYCDSGYVDIGSDDSYLSIDTNPFDIEDGSTYLSFKLVKEINKVLEFPESLDNEMNQTSFNDGKQTKEFDKFTVSWKYHPNRGLEVTYTRK